MDQDQLCCSICVEVLKQPVTLPCGHTYCFDCIQGAWDQEAEEKSLSTCPQCKETFCPRPALRTNQLLAEVVDKLRTPGVHQSSVSAAPPDYAGPEDVACDLCPGSRRHKALMSCLRCEVSCCEAHLQPHHSVPALKKHKLVPAQGRPLATAPRPHHYMCSSHNKPIEVFCRTEQQCICLLCAMDEHKDHKTVSAAAERIHRQSVQCASSSSVAPVLSSDVESTLTSFSQLRGELSALRDNLDLVLNTPWSHTESPADVSQPEESPADVSHPAVPQTREKLLQYSCPLSLDVNTIQDNLSLSEDNRKVTREGKQYPDHPKRFLVYRQVLSRESLTERCYWEVEWNELEWVYIAVSYEDINRQERFLSGFGFNSKSWCLRCIGVDCWFTHDSIDTKVTKPTSSIRETKTDGVEYRHSLTRVGVYLDHKAGTLSFYSVCNNTLTLLHTVHTTFTQPLYAGIGLHGPSDQVQVHGWYPSRGTQNVVHTAKVCKIW